MNTIYQKWSSKNPYTSIEYYYECINQTNKEEILHFVWYVDMEIKNKMYGNLNVWEKSIHYYDMTKKRSKDIKNGLKSKKIISSIAKRNEVLGNPCIKEEAIINSIYINVSWIEYRFKVDIMPNKIVRKKIVSDIYKYIEDNFENIVSLKYSDENMKKIILDIFWLYL